MRNSALQLTRLRSALQWVQENQALFLNTGSLVCTLIFILQREYSPRRSEKIGLL